MNNLRPGEPWRVVVVSSSHNDIGWAGTPTEVAEHRENGIIDSVLDLADREPEYSYAVEAALYADEYLARHPERARQLAGLVETGRLEWGGTYVQPYEGLYGAEGLFRQVEYGRRSLRRDWGIESNGAWNVDVQARPRNIAQFYANAGIDYLIISRGEPGIYWWEAQDGSRLLVISLMQGHYGYPFLNTKVLHSSPLEAAADDEGDFDIATAAGRLKVLTERFGPFFAENGLPRTILSCVTADYAVPSADLADFIRDWNAQREHIAADYGIDITLEFGTARSYVAELRASGGLESIPVKRGEMPNPWLYIHGPGHHKTVDAMRKGEAALLAAEQLVAFRNPSGLDARSRERCQLDAAWRDHLYSDHGFGGLHGTGTDEVFRYKAESALHTAMSLVEESLVALVAERGVGSDSFVLHNPLSEERREWVEIELDLAAGAERYAVAFDGEELETTTLASNRAAGVAHVRLGFVSPAVAAFASIVLDVRAVGAEAAPDKRGAEAFSWFNSFYSVHFARGGIFSIQDETEGLRVCDGGDYYLGEVISLGSPGIDVGTNEQNPSFDYRLPTPYQPTLDGFERSSTNASDAEVVFSSEAATRVRVAGRLGDVPVESSYTFYAELPYFDVDVEVRQWTGQHARELRVCFPFASHTPTVRYEVAGGSVEAGVDEIEGFHHLRPREVQNWITASDERRALTVAGGSAVWDWIDVAHESDRAVLQAVLLATKRSCHSAGDWYDQAGTHRASFRVNPTRIGIAEAARFGAGRARPMLTKQGTGTGTAERGRIGQPAPFRHPGSAAVTAVVPTTEGVLYRVHDTDGSGGSLSLERLPNRDFAVVDPFGDAPQPVQGDSIELPSHGFVNVLVRQTTPMQS